MGVTMKAVQNMAAFGCEVLTTLMADCTVMGTSWLYNDVTMGAVQWYGHTWLYSVESLEGRLYRCRKHLAVQRREPGYRTVVWLCLVVQYRRP